MLPSGMLSKRLSARSGSLALAASSKAVKSSMLLRSRSTFLVGAAQAQLDVSQLDDIAGLDVDALVGFPADAHPVRALQIDDRVAVAVADDLRVMSRDRGMVDDDVVLFRPADDHRRPIDPEL